MNRLVEIVPGIYVATGEMYVTNSTVVASHGDCLLIDPAVTVRELDGLADDLAALSLTPRAGFATHPHWDHVLWSARFGDVPRFASALASAVAVRERDRLIRGVQRSAPGHDLALFGQLTPLAGDGTAIDWGGPAAQVVTHQGHAPGHSALFFPDSGTLVSGDMCSDIEMPLLDLDQPDPVGDYLAALDQLGALGAERVIPGHGAIGDAAELHRRIEADVRYLDALLRGDDPDDPRIGDDWLAAEHRRQADWLSGRM